MKLYIPRQFFGKIHNIDLKTVQGELDIQGTGGGGRIRT